VFSLAIEGVKSRQLRIAHQPYRHPRHPPQNPREVSFLSGRGGILIRRLKKLAHRAFWENYELPKRHDLEIPHIINEDRITPSKPIDRIPSFKSYGGASVVFSAGFWTL
jgi:hypothetical protein